MALFTDLTAAVGGTTAAKSQTQTRTGKSKNSAASTSQTRTGKSS